MPETPATLHSASKRCGSVCTISATPWGEPISALMKASSGRVGSLMSTPMMSAPSAWASSPTRAPMPDETPVMTIVFPRSMSVPSLTLVLGFRAAARSSGRPISAREAKAVADRQKSERGAILDPAPDAAREEKRKNKRGRAEADEIPDAHVAKPGLDGEEDDGAENRALERPQSPNQRHEDHVGRPERTEISLRLKGERGGHPQCSRQGCAKSGEREHKPLGAHDSDANRFRRLLIVADGLD